MAVAVAMGEVVVEAAVTEADAVEVVAVAVAATLVVKMDTGCHYFWFFCAFRLTVAPRSFECPSGGGGGGRGGGGRGGGRGGRGRY